MNIKTPLILCVLCSLFLTASCSNRYVSTNVDQQNFSDYFSPTKVKIYKNESNFNGHYQFLGAVEGQDCQVEAHHAAPDEINARTEARRQAFSLQANGIVFSKCALLPQEQLIQLNNSNDAKQCYALVICYGKAYAVETEPKKSN